jgi:ankyrin repeat protein
MDGSALERAVSGGHDTIVQLLLEKGADVNGQEGMDESALERAASGGHGIIVQLLLEKGADVNAQGGDYGSALQAAASGGHGAIVQLLIDRGGDVNAQGGMYGGVLQAAVLCGHDAIVSLLLETAAALPNPRMALPELKLVRCRPCTRCLSTSPSAHSPLFICQGSGWVATFNKHVLQRQVDVNLIDTNIFKDDDPL